MRKFDNKSSKGLHLLVKADSHQNLKDLMAEGTTFLSYL